jgi:hypothetical protein
MAILSYQIAQENFPLRIIIYLSSRVLVVWSQRLAKGRPNLLRPEYDPRSRISFDCLSSPACSEKLSGSLGTISGV